MKKPYWLIQILIFLSATIFAIVSADSKVTENETKTTPGVNSPFGNVSCEMCKQIIQFVKGKETQIMGASKEYDVNKQYASLIAICSAAAPTDVCVGLIKQNLPLLVEIIKEKNLNECHVCQTILEYNGCCDGGPAIKWQLDLEKYGPKPADCSQCPAGGEEVKKIAHITDTHWDPKYIVGSSNVCKEPICCRSGGNMPQEKEKQAGIFGSYRACDVPLTTLETTLQNMREQHGHEIIFVVVTGDFVAHNIWETTKEQVIDSIKQQTELINKYFPKTPVYYAMGNHDMHPTNLFANPAQKDYTNWLYKVVNEQWTQWLDDEARATINKGGFYTHRVKDGPRIISLNSMYCYVLNWWLIYDPIDPAGQLIWLADTLHQAEANGEMVYIIQHISVGTVDCLQEYSRELWRILSRFQCIIKALFTGHAHLDETKLIYDIDDLNKPIIPVHNGGSVTTFEEVNVNYKVYDVDTKSWDILNAESWIFNLNEPGETAKWYKLYSFKDEFNVPSTKPEDLDKAVQQLATSEDLMRKYNWFYAKGAETEMWSDCDSGCLRKRLCEFVTTNYANTEKCKQLPIP